MNTLNRTTARVNKVTELIGTKNITQTNNLIKNAGVWVADQLGLENYAGGKKKGSRKGKERANWCTQER